MLAVLYLYGYGFDQEGVGEYLNIKVLRSIINYFIQNMANALNSKKILERYVKFLQKIDEVINLGQRKCNKVNMYFYYYFFN